VVAKQLWNFAEEPASEPLSCGYDSTQQRIQAHNCRWLSLVAVDSAAPAVISVR